MMMVSCWLTLFLLLSDDGAVLSEEQRVEEQRVEEQQVVILHCPRPVTGTVLWSRQRGGSHADILSADGDRDRKYMADPEGRFRSGSDQFRSLIISRVSLSDSGRYLCDRQPAVDLTVTPAGSRVRLVPEKSSIALRCLPAGGEPDVPSWRTGTAQLLPGGRFHVSPLNQTLIISEVQLGDSGLYQCGRGQAIDLRVIPEKKQSDPPPDKLEHRALSSGWQPILRVVLVLGFLFVLVIITAASYRTAVWS